MTWLQFALVAAGAWAGVVLLALGVFAVLFWHAARRLRAREVEAAARFAETRERIRRAGRPAGPGFRP